ncbi:MAG: 50S ribosomal protein L23 [Candidatus Diapherotrites archaeon]
MVEKEKKPTEKKKSTKNKVENNEKAEKLEVNVEKKQVQSKEEIEASMKGLEIIKYPLITEKAVGFIESENKLTFIVHSNADKKSVKEAVERVYNVKVNKVNIVNDMKARKKAIVTLDKKFKAGDIATKLGVV